MARPRSNKLHNKGKGTAFGKQSDAEKSFRKRGRSPRGEDSNKWSRPSGDKINRPVRPKPSDFRRNEGSASAPTTSGRAKAPFRSSSGNFGSSDKPDFRE